MQKSAWLLTGLCLLSISSFAAEPDWSVNATVPPGGRANIYLMPASEFSASVNAGRLHAQVYPVTVTGILPPLAPIKKIADDQDSNPLKSFLNSIFKSAAGIHNFDDVLKSLGLHPYPAETDQGVYQVPYPGGIRPETRLGFGTIERDHAVGFSFSCAACHSGNLFGKTVLGLTNRFPRANDFFVNLIPALSAVQPDLFRLYTGASKAETDLLKSTKNSIGRVQAKTPVALGLDTSLAQVALSLNRRSEDEWASPSNWAESFPRKDERLDDSPADSKPAVWWNVKYKNRWLSDGSVLSGNPIFTNLIWNEVGRGADLHVLSDWLQQNTQKIQELTSAVFASEAPRWTDFFPAETIDLEEAKAGEKLFLRTCARCHGEYEKAWSLPGAEQLTAAERLATVRVLPLARTPVIDVGTDAFRREGMKSLEQLNRLAISKASGVVIQAQKGYVPPPLVGIWARWPYFHNNSVPSLSAVLTRSEDRPAEYYSGEANDPSRDFDADCNGYPLGSQTPSEWQTDDHRYDTSEEGLSNAGHDEGIFLENGKEKFTPAEKRALIRFLQTL